MSAPPPYDAVVLGDSVPMSRATGGQTAWDAWPQLLYRRGILGLTWMRAMGAATSRDVLGEARRLSEYLGDRAAFDVTIVQVGIVDSCPRPFPRRVQRVIDAGPWASGLNRQVRSRYPWLLSLRSRPWVTLPRYEANVESTLRESLRFSRRAVMIETLPPGGGLIAKVGDFTQEVLRYNDAARSAVGQVGPRASIATLPSGTAADELLLDDGHHLSIAGHRAVADAVARALDEPGSGQRER